jgi:hypothetical protein
MSDAFFKNLELQKKEMGQSFWACPSCISFASTFGAKVNQKLKEVNDRVDTSNVKPRFFKDRLLSFSHKRPQKNRI